jgi:hypothetical protein
MQQLTKSFSCLHGSLKKQLVIFCYSQDEAPSPPRQLLTNLVAFSRQYTNYNMNLKNVYHNKSVRKIIHWIMQCVFVLSHPKVIMLD